MGDPIRAISVAVNFFGSHDLLAPSALPYEGHGPSFMKIVFILPRREALFNRVDPVFGR
jgi:hypothetical protein